MIETINAAGVVEEVTGRFRAYNATLDSGDAAALNDFFWDSASTVRFGPSETLFGIESIAQFRLKQWKASGAARELVQVMVTAFGSDMATTNAVFRNMNGKLARQSQTWGRFAEGWKIVAAHVSMLAGDVA